MEGYLSKTLFDKVSINSCLYDRRMDFIGINRLHIGQPDGLRLFIEFLIYAAVNAQTEHLFLEEPFVWFSEIHKWQRFMW
ncbi:unnamed protein product [Rhizophagus irregularis]|nr:unnamed protein product [Rhizophagus irregularis]